MLNSGNKKRYLKIQKDSHAGWYAFSCSIQISFLCSLFLAEEATSSKSIKNKKF